MCSYSCALKLKSGLQYVLFTAKLHQGSQVFSAETFPTDGAFLSERSYAPDVSGPDVYVHMLHHPPIDALRARGLAYHCPKDRLSGKV